MDNNIPTQFFDWSRTDFKCVLSILNTRCIETLFNIENIVVDNNLYKHNGEVCLTLKNFDKDGLCLLYHHDILYKKAVTPVRGHKYDKYTDIELHEQLTGFINKYRRRYVRLLELIKTNEKICFLYFSDNGFDYNDCDLFNTALTSINNEVIYSLVLLIREPEDTYEYIKCDNYFKLNLTHFLRNDIVRPNWTRNQYNWKRIFETIQQYM
jgi:hypothetical protein